MIEEGGDGVVWKSWNRAGGNGDPGVREVERGKEHTDTLRKEVKGCQYGGETVLWGTSAAKHSRGERLHRASFPRPPSIVTFSYWCRVLGPDQRPTDTMLPMFGARSACFAQLSPDCLPSPMRGGNQSHTRHPTCSTALLGQCGKATGAWRLSWRVKARKTRLHLKALPV